MNTTDYFRELQATYSKIAERYAATRDKMLLVPELELFTSLLKGTSVLDAGCGPGRDMQYFLQKGLTVTGIDFTEQFILLAKQRVPVANLYTMNILDLKFGDQFFNGIWCCAVLSHVKKVHLPIALREFHRVLNDVGILFASFKLGTEEKIVREALFDNNPRFTSFFHKREATTYLRRSGFKIIKAYTFNERDRFGQEYRDLDWIATFSMKDQ